MIMILIIHQYQQYSKTKKKDKKTIHKMCMKI